MSSVLHPSESLLESARKVLRAKACVDRFRPTVTRLKSKILLSNNFRDCWTGDRITDPRHAYRMQEADFQVFLRLLHEAYQAEGWQVKYGFCPLLIAESYERATQEYFIHLSKELYPDFDVELALNSSTRREYVDLLLQLLSPWINR